MKIRISRPISIYEMGGRSNQEDFIYPTVGEATADDSTFIVCDGMGGHDSGEVASEAVCTTMSEALAKIEGDEFSEDDFQNALSAAYDALDQRDTEAIKKMGTTLTFARIHSGGIMLAHIGDSRIYHFRPSENYVWHTRDHSLVQDLYEIGEITAEEMRYHPRRNVITRVMQPHQETRSRAVVKNVDDVKPGDWFMLCSDGVTENVRDEEFLQLLSDSTISDEEKRQRLLEMTKDSRDNHSAHIFRIESVDGMAIEDEEITRQTTPDSAVENEKKEPLTTRRRLIKNIIGVLIMIAVVVAALLIFFYPKK